METEVRSAKRVLYVVVLLSVIGAGSPVDAFNLTGTWQGKFACKTATFGGTSVSKFAAELRISQPLGSSEIRAEWSPINNPTGDIFRYRGTTLVTSPSKLDKGDAVLARCGTTEVPVPFVSSEILSWKVTTKPSTGKGGLKGTSLAMENQFLGSTEPLEGEPDSLTCKWTFKRLTTTDPLVAQCPICGNNISEFGEQCDGVDVGLSCADFSFAGGTLMCTPACRFDVSACTP